MVFGRKSSDHLWKAYSCSPNLQEITKQAVWIHGAYITRYDQGSSAPVHDLPASDKDEAAAFVALLRDCTKNHDLGYGMRVHDAILRQGLVSACSDALVIMYATCGALERAKHLFDASRTRSIFTWTALISGFAEIGQCRNSLDYFSQMQSKGLSPDAVTFICALKACGRIGAIDNGKQIHDEIVKQGFLRKHPKLGNTLINMYAKCGDLTKAQEVLEELPCRNTVSWNALIAGYADQGEAGKALCCFERMQSEGLSPDSVTFICLLKACGAIRDIDKGEELHDEIDNRGLVENNIVLGNALVDMYIKCGALKRARKFSDGLHNRDIITWNALISGYAQQGESEQALDCYELMQGEGFSPNEVTFIGILKACGNLRALSKGEQIHDQIANNGMLQSNFLLVTALVDMYAKCGAFAKARRALENLPCPNAIAWSALLSGYAEHGEGKQAVQFFEEMLREGLSLDAVTFISILKACGSIKAAEKGELIHNAITKLGFLKKDVVLGTALVDMYAKCGALNKARRVFEELSVRDAISWSALISGYAEYGEGEEALMCFERMQNEGLFPDAVTFVGILKACSNMGAAGIGEKVHRTIAKQGLLGKDIALGTALVDMYAKCGALTKALQVFKQLPIRNVVSWSALIAGYVQHGDGEQALECFDEMQREGLCPDAITYLSVLSACSRLGRVEDARRYFNNMSSEYGMKPDSEHYSCLVDLLGRLGHLDMAMQVIKEMPAHKSGAWSAILAACQKFADASIGRWAFNQATS